MLARIETLMDGMRLVTDSLAHDLRSPLTRAKGAIEMALRRPAQSDGNDVEGYRQALEQTATELETILRTLRSEEHTSELQSLMRISYAVLCLQKTKY